MNALIRTLAAFAFIAAYYSMFYSWEWFSVNYGFKWWLKDTTRQMLWWVQPTQALIGVIFILIMVASVCIFITGAESFE